MYRLEINIRTKCYKAIYVDSVEKKRLTVEHKCKLTPEISHYLCELQCYKVTMSAIRL